MYHRVSFPTCHPDARVFAPIPIIPHPGQEHTTDEHKYVVWMLLCAIVDAHDVTGCNLITYHNPYRYAGSFVALICLERET